MHMRFHILCILLFGVSLRAAVVSLEPTVTERESQLLAQATAVAETNLVQAVVLLAADAGEQSSAAIDFCIGNFNFQGDQLDEAIIAWTRAVEKFPSFRAARKNIGRARLQLGDAAEAIRVFQGLVADGHADADSFLLLGHALMLRRHAVPAESAYRQVLLLDAEHPDAVRGLIQSLLEQQRLQEVRSLLRTALDRSPEDAAYWSLLANVEIALQDPAAAIRAVETARRLEACPPLLLMLLGDLYLDAGRASEAVACYDKVREAHEIPPSRFLRAVEGLVALGDAEQAEGLMARLQPPPAAGVASALTPADDFVLRRLTAEIAVLRGDLKTAVTRFREAVALAPLDGRLLLRLGDLLRETGAGADAALTYERTGRLAGFEADALVRRAQLAVDSQRYADAVVLLEEAERIKSRPEIARYLEQIKRLAE